MAPQTVFKRHEKKYLLGRDQYIALRGLLAGRLKEDEYGLHTICTVYYDTTDFQSIRRRENGARFKEKLRLRSYGVPTPDDTVFLELKKKLAGVTYKRRVPLSLAEADAYLQRGMLPQKQGQVFGEIDWFVQQNDPEPKVLICYDRIALYDVEDPALRITFDTGIRTRTECLDLSKGDWGSLLLAPDETMMEIKTASAVPLWLASALSCVQAYPCSFSKYGDAYESMLYEGVRSHAG